VGGACGTRGRGENGVLLGKTEENIPLGKPRRRWEDVIRMDLRDIGWRGVEWIQ
jgi:hypothetical protein